MRHRWRSRLAKAIWPVLLLPVVVLVVPMTASGTNDVVTPPHDTIDTIVGGTGSQLPAMQPFALASSGGKANQLWVSDPMNRVVRQFHLGSECTPEYQGVLAGNLVLASGGDGGSLRDSELSAPYNVTVGPRDAKGQYFYVADTFGHRIRVVLRSSKSRSLDAIGTVAGTGTFGSSGDGRRGDRARLNSPFALAWDGARRLLYVADTLNDRVRAIDLRRSPQEGVISTVIGAGARVVPGGAAAVARFALNRPRGLAVGPDGMLYVASTFDNVVLKFDPSTGAVTRVAGTGTAGFAGDGRKAILARLSRPTGLAFDGARNLYIADTGNNRVRMRSRNGSISTYAGTGRAGSAGDGRPASEAELTSPFGVAFVPGCGLLVGDTGNNRIRRVDPELKMQPFAGNGTRSFAGDGATPERAQLASPSAVAQWSYHCPGAGDSPGFDVTDTFFLDTFNHSLRYMDRRGNTERVRTLVGDGRPSTGFGDMTRFNTPMGMAIDPVPGSSPQVNIYVSDTFNHAVRVVNWSPCQDGQNGSPSDVLPPPTVANAAGKGVAGFGGDGGPGTAALVSFPMGLAFDLRGNDLYIADVSNDRIRALNIPPGDTSGTITTISGDGVSAFSGDDEAASKARLYFPYGLAIEGSTLFVSDSFNHRVRSVDLSASDRPIRTVIGEGAAGFNGDLLSGPETRLARPWGLAVSRSRLYVADFLNNLVRQFAIKSDRVQSTVGTRTPGLIGDVGPVSTAEVNAPRGLWAPAAVGSLLIADTFNNRIRRIGTPDLSVDPPSWEGTFDGPSSQVFTVTNVGDGVSPVGSVELRGAVQRFKIRPEDDQCARRLLLPADACRFIVRFDGKRGKTADGTVRFHAPSTKQPVDIPIRIDTFATVTGSKFEDMNGDGRRQRGERGLSGWHVHLAGSDDRDRALHIHTTTDQSGNYRFDVPPGVYTICETVQADWVESASAGSDCTGHTHAGPVDPLGRTIAPGSGDVISIPPSGSFRMGAIRGVLFDDVNGNGSRDGAALPSQAGGEAGLAGWTIHVTGRDGSGSPVHEHRTTAQDDAAAPGNESGTYSFALRPGSYSVCEDARAEYKQTSPTAGVDCSARGIHGASAARKGHSFTITSGAQTIADFGNQAIPDRPEVVDAFANVTALTGASPGDAVTHTIRYGNGGTLPAGNARLTATLTRGLVYQGDASTPPDSIRAGSRGTVLTWRLGSLAPGSSGAIVFSVGIPRTSRVSETRAWTDSVHIVPDPDGNSANNRDRVSTRVRYRPRLEVSTGTCPGTIAQGGRIFSPITFANVGSAPAFRAVMIDIIPGGTSVVSAPGGSVSGDGSRVTWDLGTLDPGESGVRRLVLAVDAPNGSVLENRVVLRARNTLPVSLITRTLVSNAGSITHGTAFGMATNVVGTHAVDESGKVTTVAPGSPSTAAAETRGASLPMVGSGSAFNTTSTSSAAGSVISTAVSTATNLNLLGGIITADQIRGVSQVVASSDRQSSNSNGSRLVGLRINGVPYADVRPNTHIDLHNPLIPGQAIGEVVLYEEGATASNGLLLKITHSITMMRVHLDAPLAGLAAGSDFVIAHAETDATVPVGPVCGSTPRELSGAARGVVIRRASADPTQPDEVKKIGEAVLLPTGGSSSDELTALTVPMFADEHSVNVSACGELEESSLCPAPASPNAHSRAMIDGVGLLGGVLKADHIESVATAYLANKRAATQLAARFQNLTIAGMPAEAQPGPNTTFVLPTPTGGRLLIVLNEQIVSGDGRTWAEGSVNAIHLYVMNSDGTVPLEMIVGSAHTGVREKSVLRTAPPASAAAVAPRAVPVRPSEPTAAKKPVAHAKTRARGNVIHALPIDPPASHRPPPVRTNGDAGYLSLGLVLVAMVRLMRRSVSRRVPVRGRRRVR